MDPLKKPGNVSAADGERLTKIYVDWTKRTSWPNSDHYYKVYRRTSSANPWTWIHTTSDGNDTDYWDEGLSPDKSYEYGVETVIIHPQLGTEIKSGIVSDIGSTLGTGFTASQGTFLDRVKLEWNPNLTADIASIRVERSVPGSSPIAFEELAIISKFSTAYNDYDAIPGYGYTYKFIPLLNDGTRIIESEQDGWRKNKGIIRGQVSAKNRAGVNNVQVCVVPLNPILPAGVDGKPSYCATTSTQKY